MYFPLYFVNKGTFQKYKGKILFHPKKTKKTEILTILYWCTEKVHCMKVPSEFKKKCDGEGLIGPPKTFKMGQNQNFGRC